MIPMNIPADYLMEDYSVGVMLSYRRLFAGSVIQELCEEGMENCCEHVTYKGEWGSLFARPRFVSRLLTPSKSVDFLHLIEHWLRRLPRALVKPIHRSN